MAPSKPKRDLEDTLRRRYWLKQNFEWFMNQIIFHKEMNSYFARPKQLLWKLDQQEGRIKLDETTTGLQ